jgi:hypothetical protein
LDLGLHDKSVEPLDFQDREPALLGPQAVRDAELQRRFPQRRLASANYFELFSGIIGQGEWPPRASVLAQVQARNRRLSKPIYCHKKITISPSPSAAGISAIKVGISLQWIAEWGPICWAHT